jgi:hypothetical protein
MEAMPESLGGNGEVLSCDILMPSPALRASAAPFQERMLHVVLWHQQSWRCELVLAANDNIRLRLYDGERLISEQPVTPSLEVWRQASEWKTAVSDARKNPTTRLGSGPTSSLIGLDRSQIARTIALGSVGWLLFWAGILAIMMR